MAEAGRLKFVIEINDKGTPVIRSVNGEITKLEKTATGATTNMAGGFSSLWKSMAVGQIASQIVSAGFREAKQFITESFHAAIESEQANKRLAAALESTGRPVKELGEHLRKYADELMASTVYDDEAIKGAQALLIQLTNLDSEGLDRATKGVIGLASVMGMDLSSAAMIVAKAMAGNASMLSRYGVAIDTTKTKEEQRAQVLEKLEGFYSRATADTETYGGKLAQLKNTYGEIQEAVGGYITKNYALMDALNKVAEAALFFMTIDDKLAKQESDMRDLENQRIDIVFKALRAGGMELDQAKDIVAFRAKDIWSLEQAVRQGMYGVEAKEALTKASKANTEEIKKSVAEQKKAETGNVGFAESTEDIISAMKKFNDAIPKSADAFKNWRVENDLVKDSFEKLDYGIEDNNNSMLELIDTTIPTTEEIIEMGIAVDKTGESTDEWYKGAQDLAAGLQALNDVFNQLIPGLGDVIGGFMGAYESCMKLNAATKAGEVSFGGYASAIGAVIGVIVTMANAADAYNKKQAQEFIKNMEKGIEISTEMAEAIRLLGEEYKGLHGYINGMWQEPGWEEFHAATSEMLNELIDETKMSADAFDDWALRVHQILSDFDSGLMDTAEASAEFGDAFESLMNQAIKLGTEGSASVIAMFDDLISRGMKVAEVTKYIDEQMAAGLEGYKKMQEATKVSADALAAFGGLGIKVFDDMIAYEKKVADNQGLVDGINGATAAMIGLSNSQKLSESQFDDFAVAGSTAYQKLIDGGMTSAEALKTMGPYLQRLQFLHEQYGYTIDDATQAMIDQGIASGIVVENQKTEQQMMIDLLQRMVDILENGLPAAFATTGAAAAAAFARAAAAAQIVNDIMDNINNASPGAGTPPGTAPDTDTGHYKYAPDVYAASGFYSPRLSSDTIIQAHAPEPVAIGESGFREAGLSGSRTTILNVYIQGSSITPESAADAIITAHRNNTRGLRSLLEN